MTRENLRELYAGADWSGTDFTEKNETLANNVISLLSDLPGKRVLDLGCGSAALAVELAGRGFDVTGLDLYIEPARQRIAARKVPVKLIEKDMAEMTFSEEFDAVVNWDVSGIGMFPTDEDNIDVIRRVYEALVPGGRFLVETYNLPFARCHGVEMLKYDSQTGRCAGKISKKMPDGSRKTWELSVRLFSVHEWQDIFSKIGFRLLGTWGDLSGNKLSDKSKMLVILGR